MYSSLYSEPYEEGETAKLNCETTVKKVSVQAQLPSKFFNERLATPRVRCAVDVDEARPLRCRSSSRRPRSNLYATETEILVSASSSGHRPKPWPSRKGAEVEELVKYMSSVPCYLQRIEKGENVQEKALNFGVIDWRRLEKWTSSQKKDEKNVFFSTINLAESSSSSIFTNQTCSDSGFSNSNSPVQRQQSFCRSSSNSPAEFMTTNKEVKQIGKSSGNYMFNTDDQSSNQKVEGIVAGRKEPLPKLPSTSGLPWLNRSSSLKDVSSSHQLKDTNGLDISDDKGRSNSRGRRSPLRRILDPLLKFKYDGNSGPISSSPIQHSQEHHLNKSVLYEKESISQKSSDAAIVSSNTQMRQALVKLAWKKGQPLFMFSANDDSVLVASMRRTNRLGKEDSGGIYTIVTAEEHKKKGGIWIGLGRSGKPNLLYDVVGRMEVSSSMLSSFDSKNLELSTQFVLVSDELLPNQEHINSEQSSQLAAIIVKIPFKKFNGSIYKDSSLHIESLQVEKYPEYSRACSISAILPTGIHGFSDSGKPSTLIERWKSGGSCDCGGWDEGCRLTVLADRLHEMKVVSSVQECPTTDGFHGIELFIQGGKADNKYAFRMIAFKEGLYTVEFGSSITSLQAFAICIATLHNKNSIDVWDYSAKHKSLENSMQSNGGPTSYEAHHPPFSPVGRS